MSASINVNTRTVVHKSSNGVATTFPDVCKTPSPGGPIPIPYPNIAMSSDTAKGSRSVKMDSNPIMLKGSNFSTSTGEEAGTAGGGVVSSKTKGRAEFINYSFDVKVEGKNVPRLADMMVQNKGGAANTPPMAEVQPPIVVLPMPDPEDKVVEGFVARIVGKSDGKPYRSLKCTVKLTDGSSVETKLNGQGGCNYNGIPPGECAITVDGLFDGIESWAEEQE